MLRKIMAASLGCAAFGEHIGAGADRGEEVQRDRHVELPQQLEDARGAVLEPSRSAEGLGRQDHRQHQVHHRAESQGHRGAASARRPASTTSPPRCRSTSTTAAPSSRRPISPASRAPPRSARDPRALDARDAEGHEGAATIPDPGDLRLPAADRSSVATTSTAWTTSRARRSACRASRSPTSSRAFGASAVTIPFGEVVPALEKGVVDCGITGTMPAYQAKWTEVIKTLFRLPVGFTAALWARQPQCLEQARQATQEFMQKRVQEARGQVLGDRREREHRGRHLPATPAPVHARSVRPASSSSSSRRTRTSPPATRCSTRWCWSNGPSAAARSARPSGPRSSARSSDWPPRPTERHGDWQGMGAPADEAPGRRCCRWIRSGPPSPGSPACSPGSAAR